MERFTRHGGRVSEAFARWPEASQPWLDLSTGINPYVYPAPRATPLARRRLPDPADLLALEAAAAAVFGARADRVLAVPGAEAALRLLPHILDARTIAIPTPTYSGHAAAWLGAGAELKAFWDPAEAAVLVNPNNPDGRLRPPSEVLAEAARRRWLIVDESFADATPEVSVASIEAPELVVLRSFGKFYGLAGVRLGFVIADAAVLAKLKALLGDWPVSADALAAGLAAYRDAAWASTMRARLHREAERLQRVLETAGLTVVGDCALFRLARSSDGPALFQRLGEAGILTRPFDFDPSLVRFGLPPSSGWSRLQRALEAR